MKNMNELNFGRLIPFALIYRRNGLTFSWYKIWRIPNGIRILGWKPLIYFMFKWYFNAGQVNVAIQWASLNVIKVNVVNWFILLVFKVFQRLLRSITVNHSKSPFGFCNQIYLGPKWSHLAAHTAVRTSDLNESILKYE